MKNLIYSRLAEKPHPVFVFQDTVIPAATIWVGIRAWSKYFRELGLSAGDRIILCYPESPAFVHIVFATIWEKLSLVILKPSLANNSLIDILDARLVITEQNLPYSIQPDTMGLPPEIINLRSPEKNRDENIRFILQSSGSTGNPKFVCLTEEGILSVLFSHKKIFDSNNESVVLSVLPWSHCFGLVLDLLLTTFNSECIIRDQNNGKNLDSIFESFEEFEISHFSSVPILIERILEKQNGKELLLKLKSGIVGGAPINSFLSKELKNTYLRIGYGQTEASPGICLGEKGEFIPNFLGNPIGCEIKINENGELAFKGKNSFYGYWENKGVIKIHENSWVNSSDLVEQREEGIFFLGRVDNSFKLPNGILIQPEQVEADLKDKIKSISQCFIFMREGVEIIFSSDSLEQEITSDIYKSISPLIKSSLISCRSISSSNWHYSQKGEIDRNKMMSILKGI